MGRVGFDWDKFLERREYALSEQTRGLALLYVRME